MKKTKNIVFRRGTKKEAGLALARGRCLVFLVVLGNAETSGCWQAQTAETRGKPQLPAKSGDPYQLSLGIRAELSGAARIFCGGQQRRSGVKHPSLKRANDRHGGADRFLEG